MESRRQFIRQSAGLGLSIWSVGSLFNQLPAQPFNPGFDGGQRVDLNDDDEAFWSDIQEAYSANQSEIIMLNNGGVSPWPKPVQEKLTQLNEQASMGPSYYMWRIIDKGREPLRERLAALAGADTNEIAIVRNTTEALDNVIFGLPLQKNEEVIGTLQDYPNMINAWKQRVLRDGIKYRQLSFDFPIENDEIIVKAFEDAITPKTRLLHITHIINWVGQILPVRKICAMANKYGVEVLVDGAHSFGLLDFKISDLGCDYFGTSLHKFLSAPVGSGFLWIKKEKIGKIWPLMSAPEPRTDDIRKFENLGTRSFCIEQAIHSAIDFHLSIGPKRKQERIHFLKKYWAEKVSAIPGVKIHTSLLPEYSCAIAGVSINGLTPQQLDQRLLSDFKIHTVGISWENIHCVRVTPQVYTRLSDLDKLVAAIRSIANEQIKNRDLM